MESKKDRFGYFKKIADNFRKQWTEYLIEILVIIFSVTVSFAVNEWKDTQAKKELEQAYLKGLLTDVTTDENALHGVIMETQLVLNKCQKLLKITEYPDSVDTQQFTTDLGDIVKRPNFISSNATFQDLKSSGHLQIMRDFELKNMLFAYYNDYESVVKVENAEREATINLMGAYLIKRFPLRGLVNKKKTENKNLILTMVSETEFSNQIILRMKNREELLDKYQQQLALNAKVKNLLTQKIK
jgi:hypothetical protein